MSTCTSDLEPHLLQEALHDLPTYPVSVICLIEPSSFAAENWSHFVNITHLHDLLNDYIWLDCHFHEDRDSDCHVAPDT